MNQLAEQLRTADQICTKAYPYFERAAGLRAEAQTRIQKEKKTKRIITIVASLVSMSVVSAIFTLLLKGAGGLIGTVAGIGIGFYLYKGLFLPKIEAEFEESMRAADAEEAKGTKILEDNYGALSVIPDDYWYPQATGYLLKVVQAGRADTVNQALLLFDEQIHRWKVEEANEAILNQQQAQTKELKSIRKSSAINAAANVVNAAANVSRWF